MNTKPTESKPAADSSAAVAEPRPDAELIQVLADGSKVKRRKLRMRACNERNQKGKLCAGHLKRWYQPSQMVIDALGRDAELYRCERCRTIYVPNPAENPRTRTLRW